MPFVLHRPIRKRDRMCQNISSHFRPCTGGFPAVRVHHPYRSIALALVLFHPTVPSVPLHQVDVLGRRAYDEAMEAVQKNLLKVSSPGNYLHLVSLIITA